MTVSEVMDWPDGVKFTGYRPTQAGCLIDPRIDQSNSPIDHEVVVNIAESIDR